MNRLLARILLVIILTVIAGGILFGFYEAHSKTTHVWPVHSHHLLFILGMALVWTVLGILAVVLIARLIFWLLEQAR